jgi:hypothetical protein
MTREQDQNGCSESREESRERCGDVLQAWEMDWMRNELVMVNEGVTSRMAAGELTSQLIGTIAVPQIKDDVVRGVVEDVIRVFGGIRGLSIVALEGGEDVPVESVPHVR